MSFPPRPPMVPYGIAPGVVTMQMPTHVMVGAYGGGAGVGGAAGGGRGALLPAPAQGKAVIARGPTRNNGAKEAEGPPVTVFIGNISSRAPDAMIRSLLAACGPVLSWKRVSTFGFSEFASPEAALRCVRLLNSRPVADKPLLAKTDGKMQALVDTYKTEQRSRLGQEEGAPGTEGEASYLDARQRALDEAAERRLAQIVRDYQDDINNYELLQKEEAISKTARVLEEADISEEKRDVIHREIGKFRESMKQSRARLSVTVMDRDYGSVQHSDVLVTHIRRVLDSMGALRVTLHPRVRVLYELLRRDARLRGDHALRKPTPASLSRDQLFALDFHRTLTPAYDVNKLNRIFTTTERNF